MKSLLFLLVISFSGFGSDQVYKSRTLQKITKNSDAIIRGKVLDIEVGENRSFIYLKVIEGIGVKEDEIKDTFLKVYFNTKRLNDEISAEVGLEFNPNEEVVVFLTKNKSRYWLYQGALGKYMVEFIAGKRFLVSSVIKQNLDGGEIPLSDFYKIVEFVKSVPMKWWENNQFVNKSFLEKSLMTSNIEMQNVAKSQNRGIASEASFEESDSKSGNQLNRKPAVSKKEGNGGTSIYWLVFLLALIGGTARLMWKNT